MQCEHGQHLLVEPFGCELSTLAVEDELVGAIPVLDDVQPLVDLAPQRLGGEIAAQEDRLWRWSGPPCAAGRSVIQRLYARGDAVVRPLHVGPRGRWWPTTCLDSLGVRPDRSVSYGDSVRGDGPGHRADLRIRKSTLLFEREHVPACAVTDRAQNARAPQGQGVIHPEKPVSTSVSA